MWSSSAVSASASRRRAGSKGSSAARAQVAGHTPRALRFLAAEMKMAEATLGEIERDGLANLQQRRISLTPLRKLWISWKTVRFG